MRPWVSDWGMDKNSQRLPRSHPPPLQKSALDSRHASRIVQLNRAHHRRWHLPPLCHQHLPPLPSPRFLRGSILVLRGSGGQPTAAERGRWGGEHGPEPDRKQIQKFKSNRPPSLEYLQVFQQTHQAAIGERKERSKCWKQIQHHQKLPSKLLELQSIQRPSRLEKPKKLRTRSAITQATRGRTKGTHADRMIW